MSEQERPTSAVKPVGRQGARVEIQQRQAAMITGWLGVAVLFGLAAATYAAVQTQAGGWAISLPIIAFCLVVAVLISMTAVATLPRSSTHRPAPPPLVRQVP